MEEVNYKTILDALNVCESYLKKRSYKELKSKVLQHIPEDDAVYCYRNSSYTYLRRRKQTSTDFLLAIGVILVFLGGVEK